MWKRVMILRLSAKLSKKLSLFPQASMPLADNPFLDWSGHLFRANQRHHIILTNTPTLYSVLFLGLGITNQGAFEKWVMKELLSYLRYDDKETIFTEYIAPYFQGILYSKALNRSVVGSVNDLVFNAKYCIEEQDMSLQETADFINDMPMSYILEAFPNLAFRKQALKLHI
ncbi:DUF6933 domain-containing protein [Gemmatimonadota bacterium]